MEVNASSAIEILMWSVGVVASVVLLAVVARMIGRQQRKLRDDALVRREVIDECFAKGEMTRSQCEGGRKVRS